MVSERQIRDRLIQFLSGRIDLENFEDWFVENTWNIHLSADLGAQRLAYAIELRLAEHSTEHLPEKAFHDELVEIVNSYWYQSPEPYIESSASNLFTPFPAQWPMVAVYKQPARASS